MRIQFDRWSILEICMLLLIVIAIRMWGHQ